MRARRRQWTGWLCGALALCAAASVASARTLKDALVSTFPESLGLAAEGESLAQVFTRTVPGSFPITSTSSSYVYEFDPEVDSYVRSRLPLGPVFSERGQVVPRHKLSVAANYLLVQYSTINGEPLDHLVSVDPRDTTHPLTSGNPPRPVLGNASLDLEAQILLLSATYGIADGFDVNLSLPLVRTSLRSSTQFTSPDPRAASGPFTTQNFAASEATTGVGDLLLRAKHELARLGPVRTAAGLTVSLPTGDPANFQGTGDTLTGVWLYASTLLVRRVEPHVNVGFDLDTAQANRSQVLYTIGGDVRIFKWLTWNNDFLGASDIAQADSIDHPAFVAFVRRDIYEISTGVKIAPTWHQAFQDVPLLGALPERGAGLPWVWFFNALVPLNADGVRASHTFVFGAEAVF